MIQPHAKEQSTLTKCRPKGKLLANFNDYQCYGQLSFITFCGGQLEPYFPISLGVLGGPETAVDTARQKFSFQYIALIHLPSELV